MKPRERIRNLLNGRNIDRIPNGLGGCETAGLHNLAYDKLKRVLGVKDLKNRVCTFMNNAIFEPSVLEAMEGDLILLGTRMCPSRFWGKDADIEWKDLHIWDTTLQVANDWEFYQDPDGTWWWNSWTKCVPGALYFDAPAQGPEQLLGDLEFPSPKDFNPFYDLPEPMLKRMQEDAKLLYETTDYSIVCGEIIHDLQLQPGGAVSWWTRMIQEPDACHEFLSKAVDAALIHLNVNCADAKTKSSI
jgi:uroporphyrinogen decarboxylase